MKALILVLFVITSSLTAQVSIQNENAPISLGRYVWGDPEYSLLNTNDKLILIGSNSAKKIEIINEFLDWAEVNVNNSNIDYMRDISLTEIVSYGLAKRKFSLGYMQLTHSLNCHGTTLFYQGYLDVKRYVSASEINYFIQNYCNEIEDPEMNDIGVSYARKSPFHSFTFIGKNIIFQKKSVQKTDPFTFALKPNQKNEFKYYRCSYRPEDCDDKDVKAFDDKVSKIERKLERMVNFGEDIGLRSVYLDESILLKKTKLYLQDRGCKVKYGALMMKLDSIVDFLDSIQGMGFYRERDSLIFRESPL